MGAGLLEFVLEGEPQGWEFTGDGRQRFGDPAASREVIRLEGVVVAVLPRPDVDETAAEGEGDFTVRAEFLKARSADGRFP